MRNRRPRREAGRDSRRLARPFARALPLVVVGVLSSCYGSAAGVGDGSPERDDAAEPEETPGADVAPDIVSDAAEETGVDAADGDAEADSATEVEADDGGEAPERFPVAYAWANVGDWSLPDRAAGAYLCSCEGPRPPGPEVLVADGPCRLEHDALAEPIDLSRCRPLDFGEIRMEIGASVYPLVPYTTWDEPCTYAFGEMRPVPVPGETVRFVGTGGTELPAFDVSLVVPVLVAFTDPPSDGVLVPGEPWTIAWTPPVEAPIVFDMISRHLSLICEATTVSPLTIPSAVTAAWDEFGRWGSANNSTFTRVEGDAATAFRIGLQDMGELRIVTFAEP
jgi:hypothetical protein